MTLLAFMNTGMTGDTEEVVMQAWDRFVARLPASFPKPGVLPQPHTAQAMLESLIGEGWMEMAAGPEARFAVCAEAIKHFFRREVPVPLPLIEFWMGARVQYAIGAPGAPALLALDDLFYPATGVAPQTGWLPFPDAFDVLLAIAQGETVSVHMLKAGQANPVAVPLIDPSSPVGKRQLSQGLLVLPRLGVLEQDVWELLQAETLVLQAAAMSGQAQAMLEATLAYLSTRVQFGVPIGSFQALKHRCADLAAELHAANLLCDYAASVLEDHPDPLVPAAMAKSQCGRASLAVASEAIQMHGGMGFTWECSAQLSCKRMSFLAMNGLSVGACEQRVGHWATTARQLHWPT